MNGRIATPADLTVLLDMIRVFFGDERIPFDAAAHGPALHTLLTRETLGTVWLFEADGEAAGYAVVTYGFDLEWKGRDAIVTDLYFVPAWRGRGAGKTAMAILERGARESGVHALHLLVDPKNAAALRLYEGAHFERSHRVFMSKRLD